MAETTESEASEKGHIILWIIWGAMILTLFVYVFICHQFGDEIRKSVDTDFPLDRFRNILFGIAAVELILTFILRKFMVPGPSLASGPMSLKTKPPSIPQKIIGKYVIAMLVSLALSESIGIYGLVLYFVGDSFQTLYTFMGISVVAMFYFRPKRTELEGFAIAMEEKEGSTP